MELGISPIITASMILQVLVSTKIIDVDTSNLDDKKRYESTSKLLSIVLIMVEATA